MNRNDNASVIARSSGWTNTGNDDCSNTSMKGPRSDGSAAPSPPSRVTLPAATETNRTDDTATGSGRTRTIRRVLGASALTLVIALTGCGGDRQTPSVKPDSRETATAAPTPPPAGGTERTVARSETDRWADAWCGLRVGMSQQDTRRAMGAPVTVYDDQDNHQDQWEGYGYTFTAFYDADSVVRQLDGDKSELAASQRAKVNCPESRKG